MNAAAMWMQRVMAGTWTAEYLVPEMQAAGKSAAKAIADFKAAPHHADPFRR
jgi:hypothetical protein